MSQQLDPHYNLIVGNPHLASVRDTLSLLLGDQPIWFTAAAGEDPAAIDARNPLPCVSGAADPERGAICMQDLRQLIERARHSRAPMVGPCRCKRIMAVLPMFYKETFFGVYGVCNVAPRFEVVVQSVILVLREQIQLLTGLMAQIDDLELVHEIWVRVNSTLECRQVVEPLLPEVLAALSLDYGVALLVDEDGWFVPRAVYGLDEKVTEFPLMRFSRYDHEDRIRKWEGQAVPLSPDDPLAVWMTEDLCRSLPALRDSVVMALPFIQDGNLIGVVLGTSVRPPHLTKDRQDLVRVLAEGASAAIHNAMLFEAVRQKRDALSTVHTLHRLMQSCDNVPELVRHIAQHTRGLFSVPKCVIMLRREGHEELLPYAAVGVGPQEIGHQPIAFGAGIPGYVAATFSAVKLSLPLAENIEGLDNLSRVEYPSAHYLAVPMIEGGTSVEGVVVLARDDRPFTPGERETLQVLAEQAIVAINNARLVAEQRQMTVNVLRAIARASDAHDPHKKGHSEKVSVLADKIAETLHLDGQVRHHLRLAALLHDVGRLAADTDVGTADRSAVALSLIEGMGLASEIGEMILHQNEHWDGTGLPSGLRGEEIPIGARIIAVANRMMTLLEGRTEQPALSPDEARRCVLAESGTRFDPTVVSAL